MKEKSLLFQWIVPGIILTILVGLIIFEQSKNKVLGNQFSSATKILVGSAYPISGIGSNLAYLTTASSTYSFELTELADQVDFEITTIASTTLSCECTPVLGWTIEQSDDNSHWFQKSTNSTTGNITTYVGGAGNKMTPSITATSSFHFSIANPNSKYMRIVVSSWSATGTVFSHIGFWA